MRVESVRVEEGDTVEAGQLLALLEPDLYEAEVNAANAGLAAQRATLAGGQSTAPKNPIR